MLRHLILTGFALLGLAGPALAWNKAGHMVSGAIAYNVLLKDSPETLARALALFKTHPQYESHFKKKLIDVPEEERDLYLFMLAARWADDIRDNPTYHHGEWHYINFPFKPEGLPDSVKTWPPVDSNILRAFSVNFEALKGSGPDHDRAVAMCWIFHLVGDVHQPLHTVSLYTAAYQVPAGDRGGNLFYIRVRDGSSPIGLHQFWDDLIIGSDRFRDVRNRAIELRLREDLARDKLTELAEEKFDNWASVESFKLAKEVAHRNGKLKGSEVRESAPVLPEGYVKEAQAVAERRMVLAGYRLAATLRKALE